MGLINNSVVRRIRRVFGTPRTLPTPGRYSTVTVLVILSDKNGSKKKKKKESTTVTKNPPLYPVESLSGHDDLRVHVGVHLSVGEG